MVDFDVYDRRGYRTVDARTGYGQWVASYEDTVEDAMDLALLERLQIPNWSKVRRAVDLGCDTGRPGAWLRANGVGSIDGVDVTPEMLDRARERGAHDSLSVADVTATGLDGGAYGLVVSSLVDETRRGSRSVLCRGSPFGGSCRLLRGGDLPSALHHVLRHANAFHRSGR